MLDDEGAAGRTKLEILNDFVEDQLGYLLPDKKGVADTNIEETALDFVLDSNEQDDAEDDGAPGPSKRKRHKDNGDWKLENRLDYRPGRTANNDLTNARATLRTSPHLRNHNFVGRDGDLATLDSIFSTSGQICTICGIRGIGKTTIAIEYEYCCDGMYSYIFWVQVETQVERADTFSLIAIGLGLAPDGKDQNQLIELGRKFLEKTERKWLLIFDHVDKWMDSEEYIPLNMPKTQGRFLSPLETRSWSRHQSLQTITVSSPKKCPWRRTSRC
jgi:hypothetical protein